LFGEVLDPEEVAEPACWSKEKAMPERGERVAKKKAKRVKIVAEIDVELEPGHERDQDVKESLRDAVEEWFRREWRIHGRQPGQHGPEYPPPSSSGEVVPLQFAEDHPTKAGQQWER
jgi:hypothetical protein